MYKKSRVYSAVPLLVILLLSPVLSGAAGLIIPSNDTSSYILTKNNANMREGKLLVNTFSSQKTWNTCFTTKPGFFQPGKSYRVTVDCQTRKAAKKAYLLLLMRPFIKNNGSYDDIASRIVMDIEGKTSITLEFTIPENRNDYVFQVHTRGKVCAEIERLAFGDLPASKYMGLGNAENTNIRLDSDKLPKGAEDFKIELPELDSSNEFSVAEFGASVHARDNTSAFQKAIDSCKKQPGSRLVVPKGVYYFSSSKSLVFRDLENFEFDGQGSTLIAMNKRRFFTIDHCRHTRFCNFNIDWNWEKDPLCSVVRVERVDPDNKWADFRFVNYKRFPKENPRIVMLDLLDPHSMTVGHRKSFNVFFPHKLRNQKRNWIEPNLLRIEYDFKGMLKTGQLFRMPHYYYANGGQGISLKDNVNQTFDNIHIYSYRGTGIAVKGEQQYWQLLNSSISIPPDKPNRSISTTGDHLHMVNSKGFFKVNSCDFGYGNDDCINIHDVSSFAVKSGAKAIKTRNLKPWLAQYYHKGDMVELRNTDYSPSGFHSRLLDIKPVDAESGIYEMTFEQEVPEPRKMGFVVFNWHYDSRNIFIRNSKFHDNRGRGLLLLARDVTVENCSFRNHQIGAIHVETGFTLNQWSEGFGASNILIKNNTFTQTNPKGRYINEYKPEIYISTYIITDPSTEKASFPVLNNIFIDHNHFYDSTGAVIYVSSAQNIFICNNVFENNTSHPGKYKYRGVIGISYASDVYVWNNLWKGQYNHCTGIVYDNSDAKNIFMGNNMQR